MKELGENDIYVDLIESQFEGLDLKFDQYPKTYEIEIKMKDLSVREVSREQSPLQQVIRAKGLDEGVFFNLKYVHLPQGSNAADSLYLRILPLTVMINVNALERVIDFFKVNRDEMEAISGLQAAAQGAIKEVAAQTRTGLEYAISEHSAFDLQVLIDAPIFLIPTKYLSYNFRLVITAPMLVIDAGHMEIKSDMVSQDARRKHSLNLSTGSLSDLVELIYDKFTFKLTSLRVFVSPSLEHYLRGENVSSPNHLLENMDVSIFVEHCIIHGAREYPLFKVNGNLPKFRLNFSNSSILVVHQVTNLIRESLMTLPIAHIQKADSDASILWADAINDPGMDEFYDALEVATSPKRENSYISTMTGRSLLVLDFLFSETSISIYEGPHASLSLIACLCAKGIKTSVNYRKFESEIEMMIESVILEDGSGPSDSSFKHLVSVDDTFDGDVTPIIKFNFDYIGKIDTEPSIAIKLYLNPVKFVFVQECMLRIYSFMVSLPITPWGHTNTENIGTKNVLPYTTSDSGITLDVVIQHVCFVLVKSNHSLCTTNFETIVFNLKVDSKLSIRGSFGKVFVVDDFEDPKTILSIDGTKTAEFTFERFEKAIDGVDSSLTVSAASVRLIYQLSFSTRLITYFARFRDTQLALSGSHTENGKAVFSSEKPGSMKFYISVQTPIIEIPNPTNEADCLIIYLGQINARSLEELRTTAQIGSSRVYQFSVTSLKLKSKFQRVRLKNELSILDDINLDIRVVVNDKADAETPQTQVMIKTNDIVCKLTEFQYKMALDIIFSLISPTSASVEKSTITPLKSNVPIVSLSLTCPNVALELFWKTKKMLSPSEFSLARLITTNAALKLEVKGNCTDLEIVFQSLSLLDTRKNRNNVFRDIMVPRNEIEDQFLLKFQSKDGKADCLVTIDRGKVIFELDHLFAVRDFASYPFFIPIDTPAAAALPESDNVFLCIVNFIEPEIVLVRDPSRIDSEAVVMRANRWSTTLNMMITSSFKELGMFFCAMDNREATQLRFLDDTNITIIQDRRETLESIIYHASVETSKLLFRLSYQDFLLLTDLYTRIFASERDAPADFDKIDSNFTPVSKSSQERVFLFLMIVTHMF